MLPYPNYPSYMINSSSFSKNQLQRYPVYLKFLRSLLNQGMVFVSSPLIAKELGYSEEQIRKDLHAISTCNGRPKRGRRIDELIDSLEHFLGYTGSLKAFLVGAGNLGQAIYKYGGFESMGLEVVAAFDNDPNKAWLPIGDGAIFPLYELPKKIREMSPEVAIVTVPGSSAQGVIDKLVHLGFKAIWNFSATHVNVPKDVTIENVNLASSLAVLVHHYEENKRKH